MFSFSHLIRGFLLTVSTATASEFPQPTNNQAVTTVPLTQPAEALKMMHLPPGFKATLFAAEPDVQNPIAMCWDERGRMWVAENFTYSDSRERFDLKLRDRILIFEDKDNDGHFDQRTVFADDLQMLTSIERGFGGVYALCPPHLLWIPTKDDKPTGPPQILLDGFSTGAQSRHTFANGLKWGPDGWLYGRVGISSTSWIDVPGTPQEKRKPTAGGIWRYHPTRKVFEPYCHGTTNPWGMDWDEHGELFFINTVIGHFWHAIQGAHYQRMHGEDPYEHIYGIIDQHADHYHWDTGRKWNETRDGKGLTDTLGGGHAHVGMMIYQGTNFPPEYRGKVFMNNLHGHRVNVDRIEREGSGYAARHEPDFMKMDDPWFRATEIQYGPDGGVYILDWCDIGECHEEDGVHRTSGRIYKITYGDPVKPAETDLTKLSGEELAKLQLSDNEWLVRMSRWELRERAVNGVDLSKLGNVFYEELNRKPNIPVALKLVSLVYQLAELDRNSKSELRGAARLVAALGSTFENEHLRKWYYQSQVDMTRDRNLAEVLAGCAKTEKSAVVRLGFASILGALKNEGKSWLAAVLLSHAEDATDHNLPLMYWYGIRDLPPEALVKLVKDCRIPLVTQFIARRISEEIEKDPAPLNTLLGLAVEQQAQIPASAILTGMTDAFKGWRKARKPEAWDRFSDALATTKDATMQKSLRDLNVLFGDGRALDEVRAIAIDPRADIEARKSALRTLIEAKAPDTRKICESLLTERSLAVTATRGLATFDDPALAEMIVKRWRTFYANERGAVVSALASRPSFASVLLRHIGTNGIARGDITPGLARQIRSFNDAELNAQLSEVWGEAHDSSDEKKRLIAELKEKLTPEFLAHGRPAQGRVLFNNVCASCHKLYGEGSLIGPDLTGSGRHEIAYLIENLADPSAVVPADYAMVVITMKDGRVFNGLISAKNERTLTVKMVGQEVTIERSEIAKQNQLPTSLMPDGLLAALSDQQLSDLISYLMGNDQVELPK